jgi:thermitase
MPVVDQISVPFRTLPLALALLFLLFPQGAMAATDTQIIVKRDAGLSAAERADIRADADVRFVESLPLPQTELVTAAPGDVRDALRDLNQDPDVVYAELDRPIQTLASNDPNFASLWGLENRGDFSFGSTPAVLDADMDGVEAWGISVGSGTTVAVMDTGVDASHPDLAANMAPGWDFVDEDSTPTDGDGHGTHVAGTIGAMKDNAIGGVGVAPGARIVPLRVLDDEGDGTVSDAIQAYDYAGDHGIRIVNASLGGIGAVTAERDAIAANPGTLFVVAAGNGGADGIGDDNDDVSDAGPNGANYPCAYNLPNVLCVGASMHNDRPARFSNFGSTTVDVFAPGYGISSTWTGGGHQTLSGTSMATPHVAGAAALIRTQNPGMSPAAIRAAIVASADDTPDLMNKSVSDGRANVNATLLQLDDDADRDNWPNTIDTCPSQAGTASGCPDADGDGVRDTTDNCPTVSNAGQQNGDGRADGGDACDNDLDNDGRANGADSCPTVFALTANGCPPPSNIDGDARHDAIDACPTERAETLNGCPVPSLTALSGKVVKRGSLRSVIVRARTTRAAVLRIVVQRKTGRRWVKVKRRTLATRRNRVVLTVNRLRRGRHRVVVAVYSNAGSGTPATRRFTVR